MRVPEDWVFDIPKENISIIKHMGPVYHSITAKTASARQERKRHSMKPHPKNTLDEREKAFEAKYQLDEAVAFKVKVRRARLLGLWVAELLGVEGEEAAAYGRGAVEADLISPGHALLLERLRNDLLARGKSIEADRLPEEMARLESVARDQVIAEVAVAKAPISTE
jgi:hypothetical protein